LISTRTCGETGFAQIDEHILSVNNIIQQTLEHIDTPGWSGNLIDVLAALKSYRLTDILETRKENPPEGLIPNQKTRFLMIPPEHRHQVAPVLDALKEIES
jgi:hypothetical protein